MIRFTIKGIAPFDGVHDLDFPDRDFNIRELNVIKGLSGVRSGELADALDNGDTDVMLAFLIVALIRKNLIPRERWRRAADLFLDAESGAVEAEHIPDPKEPVKDDEPVPPTPPLSAEPPSGELES